MKSTIQAEGYRVYYVRYADDFLIGVNGTYDQAAKIRQEVRKFLRDKLKLKLNMDKTHIINARKNRARFLGADVRVISNRTSDQPVRCRRTSTARKTKARVPNHITVLMAPIEMIVKRLKDQGMCKIKNWAKRDLYPIRKRA